MSKQERPLAERIAEVIRRLADARKRIPRHTPPVALLQEIDDLEIELTKLLKCSLAGRIAEVERRLADARKRIPKHTLPVGLLMEIDDLEIELAELRKQE